MHPASFGWFRSGAAATRTSSAGLRARHFLISSRSLPFVHG
jgi:hypothetical protein